MLLKNVTMTLVLAKYLPGVQTLAPASAGFARVPWPAFLAVDLVGTLLFVLPFLALGFCFQSSIVVRRRIRWIDYSCPRSFAGTKAVQADQRENSEK